MQWLAHWEAHFFHSCLSSACGALATWFSCFLQKATEMLVSLFWSLSCDVRIQTNVVVFYCLLFPTYLVLYFPLQLHFLILLCVLFCNEFNLLVLEIEFCRACKLFTSQFTSLIAAVLFAVHPVHTEAVSTNNYTEAQKTWKQIKKAFFGLYNWLVFLLHDFLPNVVSIH